MFDKHHRTGAARQIGLAVVLAAAFVVTAVLTKIINDITNVPAIWLANGILAAGLIVLRPRWSLLLVGLVVVGDVLVDYFTGRSATAMVFYASLDVIEAVLMAALARRYLSRAVRLRDIRYILGLLVTVILPAVALTSILAGLVGVFIWHRDFAHSARLWFVADLLGAALTLPALLVLMDRRHGRHFRRSPAEQGLTYGAVAVVVYFAFKGHGAPLTFLIFPALMLAAFRLGPYGAVWGALIVGAVGEVMTLQAMSAQESVMIERLYLLHLLMASLLYTCLAAALELTKQARLRRQLQRSGAQARQAHAAALVASRAKTEFLATMSHEVRTPLNSVLGFTRILLDRGDLPADARRQLGLIDKAGESLLTVVNDVLDFSRMEAGQIELHPHPRLLADLAADSLAIIASAAEAKGLAARLTFDGDADQAHLIDDHRLRQVLLNLLNNAVKFTHQGEIVLHVAVSAGEGRDAIRVEVRDTGVGLSAEGRKLLFRRFSQADGSARRAYGGSGLGLAICKGLIERMGGQIGVDSAPGAGSTFWFEIFAPRADLQAAPAVVDDDAVKAGGRILLVDDHPMNREVAVALLGALGCQVDTAEDGSDAVAKAQMGAYDLILMDIHMPGMDGLTATRVIRELGGDAAATPIIAMSADALPQHVEQCLQAGMMGHIAKPIRKEDLFAVVLSWMPAKNPAATAA